MEIFIICAVAVGVVTIVIMEGIKAEREFQTLKQDDDAFGKLWDWREKNPLESLSHPEAQRLLRIRVGAYMLFLGHHPYYDGREHLSWLVGQVEDWRL